MSSIQILNKERIPEHGCLVIPGRIDFHELLHLQKLFSDRKITWLIEESSELDGPVQSFLEGSDSGAVFSHDDADPKTVGKELESFIKDGGVLIFIHGKAVSRVGVPCLIPGKTLKTLGAFGLPMLPIAIEYPRESSLSIERNSSMPQAIFNIGEEVSAANASAANYQEKLLIAAGEIHAQRPLFNGSLATALLEGLKLHHRNKIFDGSDDSELGFDRVLAAALVFSKFLKSETDNERIGIILPPGKAGLIANLAVVFAGKTPVNINFTASHEAIHSSIRQSKVDRYITADPFVRKVASFPWPPNRDLIYIERVLPSLKKKIITWAILSRLLPTGMIKAIFGIGKKKGDDEAILLFTSGSSGEPKGVVLSHRNVLGNVSQFGSRLQAPANSRILGCLPLFHSFGCTVTLWFPVIEGFDLVTYPNPVEAKRLGELIEQHKINMLLATPTFLRGYMKRVKPEQFSSIELVITGAEKLPTNLADAFEEKFGVKVLEGYGLTETSPVTNVNLPDPTASDGSVVIPAARQGSVGHFIPGIAVKLTNPADDKPCPLDQQGIIWLRGVNIFPGYLNQPEKSAEVLTNDGWFRTGDVGRVYEDGFLYIEGRISRFSKIGGEMVPHETVEAAINKVLGLDSESERKIAIVGIPDEQKGEAIVLLSTVAGRALEQECIDLRYKLLDIGIPSLWCPRDILPVEEIPILASGKLDLKACKELAEMKDR